MGASKVLQFERAPTLEEAWLSTPEDHRPLDFDYIPADLHGQYEEVEVFINAPTDSKFGPESFLTIRGAGGVSLVADISEDQVARILVPKDRSQPVVVRVEGADGARILDGPELRQSEALLGGVVVDLTKGQMDLRYIDQAEVERIHTSLARATSSAKEGPRSEPADLPGN